MVPDILVELLSYVNYVNYVSYRKGTPVVNPKRIVIFMKFTEFTDVHFCVNYAVLA